MKHCMEVNPEIKFMHKGDKFNVAPSRVALAKKIDKNPEDHFLEDNEILSYMREEQILKDMKGASCNIPQILEDFKIYLKGDVLPQTAAYHTYESAVAELENLAKTDPNLATLTVLGKSAEGRNIVALKISSSAQSDTSHKRGVIITGLTHAREWATMESAMKVANDLVTGYKNNESIKKKVDNLEIWIVPFVNPDGYVYSRGADAWWRKNRRHIPDTGCKKSTTGVDLNRNYYDENPDHFTLWRPKGDTPCSTGDDFFRGADDPNSDTFRGPGGGSEPEVKTVLNLELKHPNIAAVLDLHSYGEMILYPWGYTNKEVPNVNAYKEAGTKVKKEIGSEYKLMQAIDLYPTSGSSMDIHQANGKIGFTFEIGQSFFPTEKELPELTAQVSKGAMAFLDWVMGAKLQTA